MSIQKDIQRWRDLTESVLREADQGVEKVESEINKTNDKLMLLKVDKLNNLIKKKYYERDEDIEESQMFQFHFEDKEDHYEFQIPLTVLFGDRTQEYAARFWDDFFSKAGIKTTFKDNIKDALDKTGNINLTMKLNKKLTHEVEDEDEFEE
jgi:hypothetical protein